jgi:PBP1b-binding outer membrane lipoprotein LpoB
MNLSFKYSIIIFLFAILFSCNTTPVKTKAKTTTNKKTKTVTTKSIILLPLGKIDNVVVNEIYNSIKRIIPDIKIIKKDDSANVGISRILNK